VKTLIQFLFVDVFCQVNDHLEVDIDRLGLTEFQKSQIDTVLKSPILQNQNIRDYSKSTNYEITPHLVYRYFAAVDWTPTYHNTKSVHLKNIRIWQFKSTCPHKLFTAFFSFKSGGCYS
jgi:hypothetical protein